MYAIEKFVLNSKGYRTTFIGDMTPAGDSWEEAYEKAYQEAVEELNKQGIGRILETAEGVLFDGLQSYDWVIVGDYEED